MIVRALSVALIGVGVLLILAGMYVFDFAVDFTFLSTGEKTDFLTCRTDDHIEGIPGRTRTDPSYCIADFFTSAQGLSVTVPSLGLQAAGAAIIILVLRKKARIAKQV